MTADAALLLLHGARDTPGSWARVAAGLRDVARVVTPVIPGLDAPSQPFSLERSAGELVGQLDAEGLEAPTVCGVGLGAMLALQLAASQPGRVASLVLVTRQVRLSPLLMSLPAVVLRLLPATRVQRLGAGNDQVRALLDQVRPVDFAPVAAQVQAPAVVLCGARDPVNKRTSSTLARTLPAGRLQLLPGAGPGWVTDSPDLLVAALVEQLAAQG